MLINYLVDVTSKLVLIITWTVDFFQPLDLFQIYGLKNM